MEKIIKEEKSIYISNFLTSWFKIKFTVEGSGVSPCKFQVREHTEIEEDSILKLIGIIIKFIYKQFSNYLK